MSEALAFWGAVISLVDCVGILICKVVNMIVWLTFVCHLFMGADCEIIFHKPSLYL